MNFQICFRALFVSLLCFSFNGFAGVIDVNTELTVLRPASYNGDLCDQAVFSGPIAQMALPGAPIIGAQVRNDSSIIDPAKNRAASLISINQGGQLIDRIRIEGNRKVLEEIQQKMAEGQALNLTEFKNCADKDSSLLKIDLFTVLPESTAAVEKTVRFDFLKKAGDGTCTAGFQKTFDDILKSYFPALDLSKVRASLQVYAHSISSAGVLESKRVVISFKNGNGMALPRGIMTIVVASDLYYALLDRLAQPNSVLQMTGQKECLGKKRDDPLWVKLIKLD